MVEEKFRIAFVGKIKHGLLYQFLKEKGWTQSRLAKEVGVSPNDVTEWMALKRYPRKPEVLQKLMELTGKSPWELFPKFMREPEWREQIKNLPREYAVVRNVEVKALKGGRLLALPSAEDEYLSKRELERQIRAALKTLTPLKERILTLRFGLFGEDEHTQKEIGKMLHISPSAVRQAETRAILQLRRPRRGFRELRDWRP